MKIRIMLVDDHEIVRNGVANLIRREPDFQIVGEASDGESAVDLAREIRPDVILMDINLPGMDGIQATRIICDELKDVRIIGFSVYDEESHREAMLEAGAVDYFAKRGSAKDLIKKIRSHF
jgi:DNA-binding NarL/FixJ family response regulator